MVLEGLMWTGYGSVASSFSSQFRISSTTLSLVEEATTLRGRLSTTSIVERNPLFQHFGPIVNMSRPAFQKENKTLRNNLRSHVVVFVSSSLLIMGCSESSIPTKPPTDNIYHDYYGLTYHSPAVTMNTPGSTFWVQEIVSDFQSTRRGDEPDSFTAVPLDSSCRVPRPSSGAEVTFIEIGGGTVKLPLHFVDIPHEGEQIPGVNQGGGRGIKMKQASQVRRVDVIIGENQAPVYLMLSAYSETLWVLHVSENVDLEGVAVVGYEAQGLTNVPTNTKVGFVVYGKPQQECWKGEVGRPVDQTWGAFERLKDKRSKASFEKEINDAKKQYANFQTWVRWHIGHPDTIITAYTTSHVLVGAKPKTPIPYQSLKSQKVLYTPTVKPMWG